MCTILPYRYYNAWIESSSDDTIEEEEEEEEEFSDIEGEESSTEEEGEGEDEGLSFIEFQSHSGSDGNNDVFPNDNNMGVWLEADLMVTTPTKRVER